MKRKLIYLLIAIAVLVAGIAFTQQVNTIVYNPKIDGWLFADGGLHLAGEKTWTTTGTTDSLNIPGLTTDCVLFITPKTATGVLSYDVITAGDYAVITSSSSETGSSDKYSWMVIRNGNGATD